MELRWYTFHKLAIVEDALCQECGAEETIEHVLCRCPALLEARTRHWNGEVTVAMMVTEPEVCRRILSHRYPGLKFKKHDKKGAGVIETELVNENSQVIDMANSSSGVEASLHGDTMPVGH